MPMTVAYAIMESVAVPHTAAVLGCDVSNSMGSRNAWKIRNITPLTLLKQEEDVQ